MTMTEKDVEFLRGLEIAGKYRVRRLLHNDARSYAFEVEQLDPDPALAGRPLALRIFAIEDSTHRDQALNQLRRFESLNLPGLARPLEIGQFESGIFAQALYLVRELGERSLADLISEQGALGQEQLYTVAHDLSEGLCQLHENNLLHLHLSASNAFRLSGWKLSELSLDRLVDLRSSLSRLETDDLRYIAPELQHGGISPAADVYAFGVVLYDAQRGFSGRNRDIGDLLRQDPSWLESGTDYWTTLANFCRRSAPLERPRANLLYALISESRGDARALAQELARGPAYRLCVQRLDRVWGDRLSLELGEGRHGIGDLVSAAGVRLLDEGVHASNWRPILNQRLMAISQELARERYGVGLAEPVKGLFDFVFEDPPLRRKDRLTDFFRRWIRSLRGKLPAREDDDSPRMADELREERALATTIEADFLTAMRVRVATRLHAVSEVDEELLNKTDLETTPEATAAAVVDEFVLAARTRVEALGEEQISLDALLARREADAISALELAERLRDQGALALSDRGAVRYPAFQFDDEWRLREDVAAVNRLLRAGDDPWGAAAWWFAANARINGRSPRELVESAPEQLLQLAEGLLAPVG